MKQSLPDIISSWCNFVLIGIVHSSVLITPFIFTSINDELFEFSKMLFIYFLAIVAIGAISIKTIIQKRWIFSSTAFDIPIGLFLLSQIISTLFSIHPYTSIWGYYSRFNGGLLSLFAYSTLYYVTTHVITKKHLPALLFSLMVGLLGSSLYAFPEHFGISPSCVLITGEFSANCWQQDVQLRVFGTFGQPNWLAAYQITLMPLAFFIGSGVVMPHIRKKLSLSQFAQPFSHFLLPSTAIVAFLVSYPTLLFTKSRSGFIGFVIGMALLLFAFLTQKTRILFAARAKKGSTSQKKLFQEFVPVTMYGASMALFIILVSFSVGIPYSIPKSALARLFAPNTPNSQTEHINSDTQTVPAQNPSTTPQPTINRLEVGGTDSGVIRTIVWEGALNVWRRYPLFGSGVETFAYSYYLDRPLSHNTVSEWDFLYNKAHNEFLNFLATTGIFGFTTYVLLLVWFVLRAGISALRLAVQTSTTTKHSTESALLFCLISGVISASISNFFGFSTVLIMVLLYVFFALADSSIRSKTPRKAETPSKKSATQEPLLQLSWLQKGSIGLVTLLTLIGVFSIGNRWRADVAYAQGKIAFSSGDAQAGLEGITKAIMLQPQEALFYDELADAYARIAVASLEAGLATEGAQLAQASVDASTVALQLNPTHLTFYKTRTRIFTLLAQYDASYLKDSIDTLNAAISRAPTDPKLVYYLAQAEYALGNSAKAIELLESVITMKPNYESARMYLAELYEMSGNYDAAKAQYRYVLDSIAPNNTRAQEKITQLDLLE